MGYEFATRAGVTIGVKDLTIPESKKHILAASQAEVDDIEHQYRDGIITRTEKYNKVVDVWTKATQDVSAEMIKDISYDILTDPKTGKQEKNQSFNPIFMAYLKIKSYLAASPLHVRWELYPVPHEGSKTVYGGSFMEEKDWWTKPRHIAHMLALGLNIVVGLAGQLVLGYVAFYAIGAYTYGLLNQYFGLGFWTCLPIGGFLTVLFGLGLGFPVLRLRGDYLAIVTLGFGEIVRLTLQNWNTVTGGPRGVSDIPRPGFFGMSMGR